MAIVNSYEEFCQSFRSEQVNKKNQAELQYYLRSWFIARLEKLDILEEYSDFDELTSILSSKDLNKDGLTKIVEESCKTVNYLTQQLSNKIVRENALVPIHKVREINGYSLNWLSKRNGRNIREKLSGRSSMMAVVRRISLDTGENRLFMAFVKRMADTLEMKREYLPSNLVTEQELEFQDTLLKLLRVPDLDEIRQWENLPPNNTLLSDKHYSIIWKSWNELQKLDEYTKKDSLSLDAILLTYLYWNLLQEARKEFTFPQQPVKIDYETFRLDLLEKEVVGYNSRGETIKLKRSENSATLAKSLIISFRGLDYELVVRDLTVRLNLKKNTVKIFPIKASGIDKVLAAISNTIWKGRGGECTYDNKIEPIRAQRAVIDILAVRPRFAVDNAPVQSFPFRVMRQVFGNYDISTSMSGALLARYKDTLDELYTLYSVLNNPRDIRGPQLLSMIADYLKVNKLSYIFPDMYNDFQLSQLRKSLRVYYGGVEGIPKSIASVFAYLKSKDFSSSFKPNDSIIVIDRIQDRCSLSLIVGDYNKNVFQSCPETKGIVWERHPTVTYDLKDTIKKNGFGVAKDGSYLGSINPEMVASNYGIKSIEQEDGDLILTDGENSWLTVKNKIKNLKPLDVADCIDKFVAKKQRFINKGKFHLLFITDKLGCSQQASATYATTEDCLEGVRYLDFLSEKAGTNLWKDHLPDLAIKQLVGCFDLVKDQKIEPKPNNVIEIKIDKLFVLPAGKEKASPIKEYHFKLQQDEGDKKMQYEAVVKHSAFPLKRDVECRLRMTYCYGDDDPYTLIFEPIDKAQAGFNEAKVEWKPIEMYDYQNSIVPEFPTMDTWSTLQNFKNKKGESISLLELIKKYLEKSVIKYPIVDFDCFKFINQNNPQYPDSWYAIGTYESQKVLLYFNTKYLGIIANERHSPGKLRCELEEKTVDSYMVNSSTLFWKKDRNGNNYTFANVVINGFPNSVFIHENNFLNYADFQRCYDGYDSISFEIYTKKGKLSATNIISCTRPVNYYIVRTAWKNINLPYNEKALSNPFVLFSMHKVFFNDRDINSNNCPLWFRKIVKEYIPKLIAILPSLNGYAKSTVIKCLCLMSCSGNTSFYPMVYEMIEQYSGINMLSDEIGCLLKDCSASEQIELFNRIISIPNKIKILCILSKGVWKNEDLILNADLGCILDLFDEAVKLIVNDKVTKPMDILMLLEYIIAVFRLRKLHDDSINKHLSLNNPLLEQLYSYIEQMIETDYQMPASRLSFEVNMPEEYQRKGVPVFLFACLVYISGDASESQIKITDISESGSSGDDD